MCINLILRLVSEYLYVFGMRFPLVCFGFVFRVFLDSSHSLTLYCISVWKSLNRCFCEVFFGFVFLKFLVCSSLVFFYSFLPALDTECLVLFHLIVLAAILLPSLLEGKGLSLIFTLKESSWTLTKPLETKWWGRLQWEYPRLMSSSAGCPYKLFLQALSARH